MEDKKENLLDGVARCVPLSNILLLWELEIIYLHKSHPINIKFGCLGIIDIDSTETFSNLILSIKC